MGTSFKDRLRKLKDSQQKTAKEIARNTGVSPATVFAWLQGKTRPRADHLAMLAQELNTTADYLAHGDRPAERSNAVNLLRSALPDLTTPQIQLLASLAAELKAGNRRKT